MSVKLAEVFAVPADVEGSVAAAVEVGWGAVVVPGSTPPVAVVAVKPPECSWSKSQGRAQAPTSVLKGAASLGSVYQGTHC